MAFNLALNTVKDALVEALSAPGKTGWHCELCNGRVTAAELKKFSVKAPGVLVTVLNVDGWDQPHQTVTFAAFTLGKDITQVIDGKRQKIRKGDIAEALAMTVMETALHERLPGAATRPGSFRAQNLYSGGVNDQGAALWGVTWKQAFSLKPAPDGNASLVDMVEVWLRPTDTHDGPYAGATIDVSNPPQGEANE